MLVKVTKSYALPGESRKDEKGKKLKTKYSFVFEASSEMNPFEVFARKFVSDKLAKAGILKRIADRASWDAKVNEVVANSQKRFADGKIEKALTVEEATERICEAFMCDAPAPLSTDFPTPWTEKELLEAIPTGKKGKKAKKAQDATEPQETASEVPTESENEEDEEDEEEEEATQ